MKKSAIFDLFLHCGVRATNVGRELNMNKVFKVVWSATKHAYVVTSELAKSHQKSATTIVAAVILAASFSGGVANASSPEDWARADLIGSQRWLTPDQNAWGHMQDQHQVDPQHLDQQQQQQQQQQQKEQQKEQKQKEKQQPKPKEQMSKENAEQLLNAAIQDEKATQQRLKKATQQPSRRTVEKNW